MGRFSRRFKKRSVLAPKKAPTKTKPTIRLPISLKFFDALAGDAKGTYESLNPKKKRGDHGTNPGEK